MSPGNSPRQSPGGSSPSQAGMSPVKSPVSSLPPLNGSLNVAKRRKVDGLSPSDHRRVYSAASPRGTEAGGEAVGGNVSPMASLVTPSKRSVSTPARLGTPRGGQRTPSLADRPIPVLMPREEEDEVSRSRRSSYANLYVMEDGEGDKTTTTDGTANASATADKEGAREDASASNGKSIPEAIPEDDSVSTDKGKEIEETTPDTSSASTELQSISKKRLSDESFSESAPIESTEADKDKLKATLLPPPPMSERLVPPASPKKR
ncbi:hypothetical protein CKK34_4042 [Yarrowia sp. E02]|nr:hypothetical protein CKK34_4042 [Yarrowia sp. E02]